MKKKISFVSIIVLMIVSILFCVGCSNDSNNDDGDEVYNVSNDVDYLDKVQLFYDLVSESQHYLDIVAASIYDYWHDAVYGDYDISLAVWLAQVVNEDNINIIKENDEYIKNQYKLVRDGKLSAEVKAVINAYNEYYDFVINVSGSFSSYSSNKETLKRALNTSLNNLYMEL